eukprot:1158715-Pelagomonas_calceolata.AAC.5
MHLRLLERGCLKGVPRLSWCPCMRPHILCTEYDTRDQPAQAAAMPSPSQLSYPWQEGRQHLHDPAKLSRAADQPLRGTVSALIPHLSKTILKRGDQNPVR